MWHKVSLTRTLVTLSKSRSLTLQGSGWWVWHCRKCQRIECNERSRQSLTSGQDVGLWVNGQGDVVEPRVSSQGGGFQAFQVDVIALLIGEEKWSEVEERSMGGPEGEGAQPFMVWSPPHWWALPRGQEKKDWNRSVSFYAPCGRLNNGPQIRPCPNPLLIVLAYPDGSNVITWTLIRGSQEGQGQRGDVTTDAEVRVTRPHDNKCRQLLKAGKSKELDLALEISERTGPANTLTLAHWDWFWTSDIKNIRRVPANNPNSHIANFFQLKKLVLEYSPYLKDRKGHIMQRDSLSSPISQPPVSSLL